MLPHEFRLAPGLLAAQCKHESMISVLLSLAKSGYFVIYERMRSGFRSDYGAVSFRKTILRTFGETRCLLSNRVVSLRST